MPKLSGSKRGRFNARVTEPVNETASGQAYPDPQPRSAPETRWMDDTKVKRIRQKVKEEFRVGRVRLATLKGEKKLLAQNNQDRERLFAFFKSQGLEKELELNQTLLRVLMNYSKLASYRGVREGFRICAYAAELRADRARLHVFEYLRKHPEATNQELVKYLDTTNERLAIRDTPPSDPHWAPLPAAWKRKFKERGLLYCAGAYWKVTLQELPTLVMPYLARIRKMAKDARVNNVLFNWPEIFKRHRRERK